jgi:CDP-diacylglycerol--inositol 3-phosphatidyltransferase
MAYFTLLLTTLLLGYLRVCFMVAAFYYARSDWRRAVSCYLLAFAGDVLDGFAARYFQQCSEFGGVLDMVTDRCALRCLLTCMSTACSIA